jgi:hypothetical protein
MAIAMLAEARPRCHGDMGLVHQHE